MATFKAEVYAHQKKQDGTYNIKIRITHNQKKKYLSTPYYVYKEDLTRALKIKNQYYIDETDKIIKKYRKICDRYADRIKDMTIDQIVDVIKGDYNERFDLDIVEYGKKIVEKLKDEGKTGNASNYNTSLNNLTKFVGREKISIYEITTRFVNNWINWIQNQPAPSKKAKGERASSLYPGTLRTIYNRAKKEFNDEDLGVIRIPYSPFQKVKLPQMPVSRKRALDVRQMRDIILLEYETQHQRGNRYNLAKDVFLLSFSLVGMNAVDLYHCTDCESGRITYNRSKTKGKRTDKAEISIKIEPEIQKLMNKYSDPEGKRVFCFYKMYSSVNTFTSALNKGLKKIGDKLGIDDLEFYAARHTWATIARNDCKISKDDISQALNHVDESKKVTDIYISKSWNIIDQANRKVLDYVFKTDS